MNVDLTPDQKAFVRQAIESGRLADESDAIREALSSWEERERARVETLAALDEAEADIQGQRFADYSNATLPQLAEELKREATALRRRS